MLVAVLAVCMDRVFHLWYLHLLDRENWSDVSYQLSCRHEGIVWNLGLPVAGLQPSGNGVHLVRGSIVDWRAVRDAHDPRDLDQVSRPTQFSPGEFQHKHQGLPQFLPVLVL